MPKREKTVESTRTLPCELTADEKISYGKKLAELQSDLARLEEEKKAVMSQYKADIDKTTAAIGKYSQILVEGREFRELTCIGEYDWEAGTITFRRPDTNEVVEVKEIPQSEYQMGIEI